MKINNVTQIRADDFPKEFKQTAEQLGNILNPFMQQVVELSDGRVDFDNKVESYKEIEMIVDVTGKPVLNSRISVDRTHVRGFQVIAAYGASNSTIGAVAQPFINYKNLGDGFVDVISITGLPPNIKMRLNIVVY